MASRFLVTGGAGFIGSHLTDHLLQCGHRVTVIDDLSSGTRANLAHLQANPRFSLVIGAVQNARLVSDVLGHVDAVFHLAASVGVEHTVARPLSTLENNILGTSTILRVATEHRRPVLLTSSSEVYGRSGDIPHAEDADLTLGSPRWSRWAYAGSKACEEYLAVSFEREHGLPITIARLFNVTGARQSAQRGMVVPRFATQAIGDAPITVYGSGQQRRCFLDVRDAARGLSDLLLSERTCGQIVNLGSEEEYSILDLAHLVRQIAGSCSDIVTVDYEAIPERGRWDVERRVPSLAKIRRLIGWRPRFSCEEAVETVVDHIRRTPRCQSENALPSIA